mmetsp:Transcript_167856/g.539133  ORF Transcript_167856/g.539133 Transcript_167856/m.539133 type:complete len:85 (-) Transcript_167856:522-776(-)
MTRSLRNAASRTLRVCTGFGKTDAKFGEQRVDQLESWHCAKMIGGDRQRGACRSALRNLCTGHLRCAQEVLVSLCAWHPDQHEP